MHRNLFKGKICSFDVAISCMCMNSTGQRMGEFDMFVKNRDSDKPFRPSLPTNWERQQQYLAAANATSRF